MVAEKIEGLITEVTTLIPAIVADVEANLAARQALRDAEAATLDRLVAIVLPALRAVGTRPVVYDYSSGGANGLCPWEEVKRASWRGVCVDDVKPGPSRDHRGDQNSGSYGGHDLYLRSDGGVMTWCRLDYSGSWSLWQGSTDGWEASETILTTAEVVARYDIDEIVERLHAAVSGAGSRAANTAAAKARTSKLAAIVALLGGQS